MSMREINPRFRPDIVTHFYDPKMGGGSIVLEDPVANKFFRISPYEYDFLTILDGKLSVKKALDKLKLRGRFLAEDHAARLLEQFTRAGLVLGTGYGTSTGQLALKKSYDQEAKKRSLSKLYYCYVPLLNPDRFLDRTVHLWRLLVNRVTALILLLLVPPAIYLLIEGLHRLKAPYLYFFNLENLLILWVAIAGVKLVHEFSHVYTAKSFGLRVPEMGFAFLIFFPCLYCNTTAAWQLADRRQRLVIAAAGVLSEASIAVIAIYIWFFTRQGIVNSLAFYLMAVSLVSSVLFNGNPLLKFDGYFVLTDILGIPNLQTKAFGYIRYLFLNRVLGIESVVPAQAGPRDRAIFVTYGILSLAYRVWLYYAIVGRIYYRFDKTIGFLLGATWFLVFVGRPVSRSIKGLLKRSQDMRWKPKGTAILLLMVGVVAFLVTRPWASNSLYPCYVGSSEIRQITVPADAPVAEVPVRQGDRVNKGDLLMRLDPTPLTYLLKERQTDVRLKKKEIQIAENSDKDREKIQTKLIELSQAEDAVRHTLEDIAHCEWRAPFAGVITALLPTLQKGAQLGRGIVAGELANQKNCEVVGLVPEEDASRVQPGATVQAWFPVDGGKTVSLKVREISNFKTEDLEGSPLSSRFGGIIPTHAKSQESRDAPLEPYYLCKMDFRNDAGLPLGLTGKLVVRQVPRSILQRFVENLYRTFRREVIF